MLKKLDEIKPNQSLINDAKLVDYRLTREQKDALQNQLGSIGYGFDSYTSFAITDKESADRPANYALIPNQYFIFASEMYEFATELFKYFEIYEKLRPYANRLLGDFNQINENIRSNTYLRQVFESDSDIELFAKFLDKDDPKSRLGSKRLINDQGKPRGAADCFGSVILKEINLPDASSNIFGRLVYDLCQSPSTYRHIYETCTLAKSSSQAVKNDVTGNKFFLSKPFLLLAGISGTGKTRFVRKQAELTGSITETYCLTSVRPDWHEPSDLLGYVSRLGTTPLYVATDVLRFIVKAWREIIDKIHRDENGGASDWQGRPLADIRPFWLCLDEMNLAPVEQYFADYLSILETRCWNAPEKLAESGLSYVYECDPLIKGEVFKSLDAGIPSESEQPSSLLAKDLGFNFSEELDRDIWDYFLAHGISIPFNLIVAGTVNMDETTHGFSRKVIDRALSFDFGEFFPNNYDEFFEPTSCHKRLGYPIWSQASKADVSFEVERANGEKIHVGNATVDFLKAVNAVLKNTPFELAYRALNELLLAVVSSQPQDELILKAVWDDFMMCKVLPRIEGDNDKLTTADGREILAELNNVLAVQLAPIWQADANDEANQRPDLYREKALEADATDEEKVLRIPCRSKGKLEWMKQRLVSATFTSFWP